jgi:hypothetical protein
MDLLIGILFFGGIGAVIVWIVMGLRSDKRDRQERIDSAASGGAGSGGDSSPLMYGAPVLLHDAVHGHVDSGHGGGSGDGGGGDGGGAGGDG